MKQCCSNLKYHLLSRAELDVIHMERNEHHSNFHDNGLIDCEATWLLHK